MKKHFILIICLLITFNTSFANQNDKNFLNKILVKKPKSYFDMYDYVLEILPKNNQSVDVLKTICKKDNPKRVYHYNAIICAYNLLGIKVLNEEDDVSSAITNHLKALKLAKHYEDNEAKIHSYNLLGICYRLQNNLRNAIDYHQKVLKISGEINEPSNNILQSQATSYFNVGKIYNTIKQYSLAINQFRSSIKIEKKLNNITGLTNNYLELGTAHKFSGNLNSAETNYKKSLKYATKKGYKIEKIIINERLADLYISKKNYGKAREIIEGCFYNALTLSKPYYKFRMFSTFGKVLMKTGELHAAETNLLKSFEYFDTLNLKTDDYVRTCENLAELFELKKNHEKSLFYLKKAVEQDKKTSGKRQLIYVTNLIQKYDNQAKLIRIKELEKEGERKSFETSKTRNILIITLITLALLGVALYSVYRQGLLNNDKKLLSLEQQALQAQMNPHFVFNALNSIKLYIINNDQRNAVYYLNKFAKLIRNILDTSRKRDVTLAEELETMDLYVTIENIRFNNDIVYTSKVLDKTLKLDVIRVPPLILQPFLENAIWHGLSSKKSNKKVNLVVEKKSEKILEISITDNGIGREKALKIKEGKSLNRKSVGIELTKERLNTFASDYVTETYVKYIDLKDKDNNSIGTKVILGIPMV